MKALLSTIFLLALQAGATDPGRSCRQTIELIAITQKVKEKVDDYGTLAWRIQNAFKNDRPTNIGPARIKAVEEFLKMFAMPFEAFKKGFVERYVEHELQRIENKDPYRTKPPVDKKFRENLLKEAEHAFKLTDEIVDLSNIQIGVYRHETQAEIKAAGQIFEKPRERLRGFRDTILGTRIAKDFALERASLGPISSFLAFHKLPAGVKMEFPFARSHLWKPGAGMDEGSWAWGPLVYRVDLEAVADRVLYTLGDVHAQLGFYPDVRVNLNSRANYLESFYPLSQLNPLFYYVFEALMSSRYYPNGENRAPRFLIEMPAGGSEVIETLIFGPVRAENLELVGNGEEGFNMIYPPRAFFPDP